MTPHDEVEEEVIDAARFCKTCDKIGDAETVIVAKTGTAHFYAGEGLTVCGLETSGW